ncbi:MAG: DUF1127 domain-containing protein [Celeribacter sp.]|jgi:uncharacterized protein YjiS (DUF1127 family)
MLTTSPRRQTHILTGRCAQGPRVGFWQHLRVMQSLRRQRRALDRLDAAQLADIGLSRNVASREAGRHFWDLPQNW